MLKLIYQHVITFNFLKNERFEISYKCAKKLILYALKKSLKCGKFCK